MKYWGSRRSTLPTLNHLVALEATARLGSFRAAAEEMHLTQGAVAQQIRALESELGYPLFVRQPRGLSTTTQGADYVDRVRLALGIIGDATKEFLDQNQQSAPGRLTLSTTSAFASRWLIPRLPRLAEAYPDISIMIDASDVVRPLYGKGRVDMAIRWGVPPFAEGNAQFLLPGKAIPVCAPILIAQKQLSSPESLADMPLISDSHNNWKRWFDAYRITGTRPTGLTFSQTSLALEAAEQGMGIALVPEVLVETALKTGALVQAIGGQYQLDTDVGFYILTALPYPGESITGKVVSWLLEEARLSQLNQLKINE
ncbi:LysR substrate-binding domain-containing protein [Glaciimonas sp. PCH181]|uniref:LysR substrate-binding domain-containing protein n=1 Tax=Glaciimonas sp. PCH181 TaxID=2133943 RepID=UPI000D39189E|nr:LysR substrate-binding domain-containing protein [Glaciimonas sp. PCH181]PUA17118.1 LysR family transcriptional regulator [Glaciimonas sp. PCH181]